MKRVLFIGEDIVNSRSGVVTVMKQLLNSDKLNTNIVYQTVYTTGDEFSLLKKLKGWGKAFIKILYYLPNTDIIHIHHASDLNFWLSGLIIYVAKAAGKKTIMHNHAADFQLFHERSPLYKKGWIKSIFNKTDINLVLSTSWLKWYSSLAPTANWVLLRNTVEIPENISNKSLINCNLILTFLARIEERKGIFTLTAILPKLFQKYPNCKLYIAGQGDTTQIKSILDTFNINENVEIMGHIDNKQRDILLRKGHLLVLPSYNEGLPMSLLEAMAYAVVPITTPVGGIPDVVIDTVNGFLVEPGNEDELLKAIVRALEDNDAYQKASNNARRSIIDKFDFTKYENSLLTIYNTI